MSHSSTSPLEPHLTEIGQWVEDGLTNAQIVERLRNLGVTSSEGSVRRAKPRIEAMLGRKLQRHTAPPKSDRDPSFTLDGDTAEINSGTFHKLPNSEELIRAHGLDPAEWDYNDAVVSWWGSPFNKNYQLKLKLRRKKPIEFVFPARAEGNYTAPKIRGRATKPFKTWLIFGCQQAPYQDVRMHGGILSLIDDVKPEGFVSAGDTVDFPSISRHKDNPEWHSTVQEGIDSAYLMLRDYRLADENMRMVKLLGNHDIRIRSELLMRAERLYGIRRAEVPGAGTEQDVLNLRNLLRLDELNIELIEPHGEYPHAQFELGNIAVIHGDKTGPNAAMRQMDRRFHSIIMAHTHTQAMGKKVIYDLEGNSRTLTGVEIGCATTVKGGLGYTVKPNWINGGAVVTLHDNGAENIELLEWDGDHLLWRDRQYA